MGSRLTGPFHNLQHADGQALALLGAILEASPDGIAVFDAQGLMLAYNQRLLELFGAGPEQLADGEARSQFMTREALEGYDDEAARRTRTSPGALTMGPIRLRNGRVLQCHSRDAVGADGAWLGRVWFTADMTESHAAAEALARGEARYRQLADHASDVICMLDDRRRITYVSPSVERMLGIAPEALAGQPYLDQVHPLDRAEAGEALGTWQPGVYTARVKHQNGTYMWLETHLSPMAGLAGEPGAMLLAARDVTDRVLAEVELRLANERLRELDRQKDALMAVVGHELRNPLSVMLGHLGLVEAGVYGQLPPDLAKGLTAMASAAERMNRIAEDLLDLAQLEAGKLTVTPAELALGPLLQQAVDDLQPIAAAKQLALGLELHVGPQTMVHADRERLEQVLHNLVTNAIKYTTAGGAITLRACLPRHGQLRLEVQDTGIGLGTEDMQHVFERFYRVEHGLARSIAGAGLGLAICKAIVEAHGGTIGVSSAPGEGSTFWLELPHNATNTYVPATAPPSRGALLDIGDRDRTNHHGAGLTATASPLAARLLRDVTDPSAKPL